MSSDADDLVGPRPLCGSFPQVPWLLLAISFVVVLVGLAMTFVGASQVGVSVDESGQVDRLSAFFDDGLYVRGYERRGVADGDIPANAYVYAPAAERVMHVINEMIGIEQPGEPSTSAAAFTGRHFSIAAMSVVAVFAVFGLAWLMLGSWRWGVVASAALVAVPMWTGHAMFNPKDTPVGVGYALMTCSIAGLVVAAGWAGRKRLWVVGAGAVGMIFGTALMVGTRPGMWPGVVTAIVIAVSILAGGRALNRWAVAGLAVGLVGSYAALWTLYPRIFSDPVAMMKMSLGQSTAFPHGLAPSRAYVFERTAIEWPLLLLAFLIIGTVVAAWLCVRLLRTDPRRATVFAVVGTQAFALPVAAIISKSNLYDGLRQLLFAVPAQAALATVGIAAVFGFGRTAVWRWSAAAATVLALVLPMIVQARLQPYQYAYGNVVSELLGAPILDDIWKVSFREHIEEIRPDIRAICPNSRPLAGPISDRGMDCRGRRGVIKPYWLAYWHHARYNPDSPVFYAVLRANRRPVPPNCTVVHDVTRKRNLKRVIMSQLLRCTTDGPGVPGGGTSRNLGHAPGPGPIPTPLDRVVKIDPAKVPDGVISYGSRRESPAYGASVTDTPKIHRAADLRLLAGAPADFKAFLVRQLRQNKQTVRAELAARNRSVASEGCRFAAEIHVWGVGPDVATGRERGCARPSNDVIWSKESGTWRRVARMEGGWDCSVLQRYRVPADITAAVCWYDLVKTRQYDGPRGRSG
jgi:hypothetical protein